MAVKAVSTLKTDLATVFDNSGLATAAEFRAFMTDVLDSLAAGTRLYPYVMDINLSEGDNAINHALGITVHQVIVADGTSRFYPDFTATDTNNTTISWVGGSLTTPTIYFLGSV